MAATRAQSPAWAAVEVLAGSGGGAGGVAAARKDKFVMCLLYKGCE